MKKQLILMTSLSIALLFGGAKGNTCPSLDVEQVNNILQTAGFSDQTGLWELHEPERTDYQYPLDKSVHLDIHDNNLGVTEPIKKGEFCQYAVVYAPLQGHNYVVGRFQLRKALRNKATFSNEASKSSKKETE